MCMQGRIIVPKKHLPLEGPRGKKVFLQNGSLPNIGVIHCKSARHKVTFDTCCEKYASQLSSVGFT
jgi:hypothetical protein